MDHHCADMVAVLLCDRDLIFRINAYSRDELTSRMQGLHLTALHTEAERDEAFRQLREVCSADRRLPHLGLGCRPILVCRAGA